jgi:hypothetical protein
MEVLVGGFAGSAGFEAAENEEPAVAVVVPNIFTTAGEAAFAFADPFVAPNALEEGTPSAALRPVAPNIGKDPFEVSPCTLLAAELSGLFCTGGQADGLLKPPNGDGLGSAGFESSVSAGFEANRLRLDFAVLAGVVEGAAMASSFLPPASPFQRGFSGSLTGLKGDEDSAEDEPPNKLVGTCGIVGGLLAFTNSGELEKKLGIPLDPLAEEAAGTVTPEDDEGGAAKLKALAAGAGGACAGWED